MSEERLAHIIAASTLVWFLGLSQFATAQKRPDISLVFEVVPRSQKVALGKPISLTFRVLNAGSQNALANRRFYLNHSVWLEISTPSGQKAQWCGRRMADIAFSQDEFAILTPGAHVDKTFQVSCNDKRTSGFSLIEPGEYLVRARYELAFPAEALKAVAQGALVMKGSLEADPIHIDVLGPQ